MIQQPKTFTPLVRRIGTINEMLKIHSGEANAEQPHLSVPLFMPLAPSLSLKDGLKCVTTEMREKVEQGFLELIAVAYGTMNDGETSRTVQFVLVSDREGYFIFDTIDGGIELAVLMDGDGRRYLSTSKLQRDEAVRQWMAGFLNWNCDYPGLYQLRYALIDMAGDRSTEGEV